MDKELNVKQRNVLRELLRLGRISDMEIARRLNYSQPTVTRIRAKLEKEGYISKYCAIPDLTKMGYEILAITAFASFKESKAVLKKGLAWTIQNKTIAFACRGEGFDGRTRLIITLHKNYTEYNNFIKDFRKRWTKHGLSDVTSFVVPLKLIVKNVTFDSFV